MYCMLLNPLTLTAAKKKQPWNFDEIFKEEA